MFSRRSLGALVVLVGACFSVVSADQHSWGGYHWFRSSNPVALNLGNNIAAHWEGHLTSAVQDWIAYGGGVLDLTVVPGGTSPRACKGTSDRIEVCSENYGFNGWLGIAQIWISGKHITKAVAKLNDSYMGPGGFAPYNSWPWRMYVMCQEVGHDFGLDHQNEDFNNRNTGSCMDYTNEPSGGGSWGPSNLTPNSSDTTVLQTMHAHADIESASSPRPGRGNGRSGEDLPPPAMGQIDFATPAQWGQLVRSSANRRGQVYELDFGGGHRVITHVLWAVAPR
jgi:hypothetical protein